MLVLKPEADRRFSKMVEKKDIISITLSRNGIFQSWKDDTLEFCDYLMYSNGALLYRQGATFLTSNAPMAGNVSISFAGSHTLLAETGGGQYHCFGKRHRLTSDFSLVLVFRHADTIVLIVADARFSDRPERFEFSATKSAEHLCLRTAYHVISMRDRNSADCVRLWLDGARHPLGKMPKQKSEPLAEREEDGRKKTLVELMLEESTNELPIETTERM